MDFLFQVLWQLHFLALFVLEMLLGNGDSLFIIFFTRIMSSLLL